MSVLNTEWIKSYITNNHKLDEKTGETIYEPVLYRWSHGATDYHMGAGMMYFSLVYYMKARNCVCLGSGGGFVPRIMSQARLELWKDQTVGGQEQYEFAETGTTIIVDACNGVNGVTDWDKKDSFFRLQFQPRFLKTTTEDAFYNFFVKQEFKIDYLHIDADHSYEQVKWDFENYSTLLSEHGIITIHDTDSHYVDTNAIPQGHKDGTREPYDDVSGPIRLIKELEQDDEWQVFNFFDYGQIREKPSSTGVTLLRRK